MSCGIVNPQRPPIGKMSGVSAGKRFVVVAPVITAFVWWLVKHGPDVDAWTFDRDSRHKR
jgi:hypothetical protein